MYSAPGYSNGPVPVLPTMNTPSYCGNSFPNAYPAGFVNNCSFPPPFGANTAMTSASPACNINAFMSVPPPGFSPSSANMLPSPGAPNSFPPNKFANPPPFVPPPFPRCSIPFPNSPGVQQYAAFPSYPAANCTVPPPGSPFTFPPPPITRPPPCNANYSKFPASNSRQQNKHVPQTKKNMPFHCESCDRDFPTEAKKKQHISEHVICGIEGCVFSAHMKIVEKHISLQHRTGLFSRIVKGNSPEEIAKWVADRKRQFPTRERKEQKQAQKEEMDQRGERYSEPRQKFNNNRCSNDNRKHNRSNKFDNSRRFPLNKRMQNSNTSETKSQDQSPANSESRPRRRREVMVINEEDDDDRCIRNLRPFRGTGQITSQDETPTCSPTHIIRPVETPTSTPSQIISEVEPPTSTPTKISSQIEPPTSTPIQTISQVEPPISPPRQIISEVEPPTSTPTKTNSQMETATSTPTQIDSQIEPSTSTPTQIISPNAASTSPLAMSTSLDLLKAYDFSDDDDEESTEIVKAAQTSPNIDEALSLTQISDDSEPEECSSKICPLVESVVSDEKIVSDKPASNAEEADSKKSRKRKRHKDNENNDDSKDEKKAKEADKEKPPALDMMNHQKRNRRPTLLEKLLANEIKHERNVILQCVRYVVQKNYFDIGQSK